MNFVLAIAILVSSSPCFANTFQDNQILLSQVDDALRTCNLLRSLFPYQVFFPNSSGYNFRQSQYWSDQQAALEPKCRYTPKNEADLRLAWILLKPRSTPIAIESGGHSSNSGASNIEAGVTIDLMYFSSITLTDPDTAVWLGPAARWEDVYATLQQYNLTVSGGRVGSVGVGGYILGGGFSWFANERGWTSDSVLEFQVLTPSGQFIQARKDWNADLFWALKGSLGAFGIVTAIKVPTIPDRAIYGGAVSYGPGRARALFVALRDLAVNAHKDPQSQGYLSLGYHPATRQHYCSAYLVNTAGGTPSHAFKPFLDIDHTHFSLRPTTFLGSAKEIASGSPLGYRRAKFTLTAYLSTEAMDTIHLFYTAFISLLDVDFSSATMLGITLQPLTKQHLQAGAGNVFSLDPDEGPLLLISAEMWWQESGRDAYYQHQMRELHNAFMRELVMEGELLEWIYPNYAASWQDPLSTHSISPEARKALTKVREKYDPDDIWRKLVPGSLYV